MTKFLKVKDVRQLLKMAKENVTIPSSSMSKQLAEELLVEGVLTQISKGRFRTFKLNDKNALDCFLAQQYGIQTSLEEWLEANSSDSRSEQVSKAGDSKVRSVRTFKGFLVNSYTAINATLAREPLTINPSVGTSIFIEDWEHFEIPKDVVVVGMENGENFHEIREQRYLFEGMTPLFVTRYPQSSDLRRWLKKIPNRYLHFGDFDLAGINIFLSEFYSLLGERAQFFIPEDIEERIKFGNSKLYDEQYEKFKGMKVVDKRVERLVEMIHRYRKIYEQEGYIVSI